MSGKQISNSIQNLLNQIAKENGFSDYSIDIKKGSEAGDGFSSDITSVTISQRNSEKNLHIVCKQAPLNENRRKEFISDKVFDREAYFYNKVMPCFAKFQEEKNLSKEDQFLAYPKCFGSIIDHENGEYAITLEDLRPQGFKLWDKSKPSPFDNARLAMLEMGKFHGISIALKHQKPEEFTAFKQLKDGLSEFLKSENMAGMFAASYDRAINALKNEDNKTIAREIKSKTFSYFEDILNIEDDSFAVVCHGDFWNNNMLYRFNEEGAANDIKILDWQIIRYVSPATDILYNLFTSTDKPLRDKEYDNLIHLYYTSLSRTIKLLGSDPEELFTFEDLKNELKKCGNYALLLGPIVLHTSQADSSQIANLDEMAEKAAKGEAIELITGLSKNGQLEYERRLNDLFDDIVRLDYYHKLD